MTRDLVAFVPMKLNNERLPGKNTREIGPGKPLFHCILDSLARSEISDIYVYCSDPEIVELLPDGVRFLQRSEHLDRSDTKINEVMAAFAADVPSEAYLMTHATAPFLSTASLDRVAAAVRGGEHDSALTVTRLQEFVWADGRPLNYDPVAIPRTQDLPPYYTETTGCYAYDADLLLNQGRRIGETPALIEVSKIEAIDINEPIDFEIAQAVYKQIHDVLPELDTER